MAVPESDVKRYVSQLYDSSRSIIKEFVEDGLLSGFKDIPMNVWYNALSSICALAFRIPEISGNEKLQEAIVYQVMLKVLQNDIPIDNEDTIATVIMVYKRVAPTVIDVLIPGKDDCCAGCCGLLARRR